MLVFLGTKVQRLLGFMLEQNMLRGPRPSKRSGDQGYLNVCSTAEQMNFILGNNFRFLCHEKLHAWCDHCRLFFLVWLYSSLACDCTLGSQAITMPLQRLLAPNCMLSHVVSYVLFPLALAATTNVPHRHWVLQWGDPTTAGSHRCAASALHALCGPAEEVSMQLASILEIMWCPDGEILLDENTQLLIGIQ